MAMHSGSVSPTSASPLTGSPMSPNPPFSMASPTPTSGSEIILFESYLFKTPPLKSFIMRWSKRWFVLSTQDLSDPDSIQLSYYKDETKREGRRIVDLSRFVGIRPSAKVGNHQHVFAIETEERKYILKAQDHDTKNIWLAKLCELFGQEQVCHVTIPPQPSCAYSEAILKLTCSSHITAITPSTGTTLLEIPFEEVRRLGSSNSFGTDIVWVETCKQSKPDQFVFCSVPSGRDVAKEVVRELKTAIESYRSVVLIMEVSSDSELSYISRDHYGCSEYPAVSRNAVLLSGLSHLPARWQTFILQERIRRESDSSQTVSSDLGASGGVSLDEWSARRAVQKKAASLKGPPTRRPTLNNFSRQASLMSFDRERHSPELSGGSGLSDSQNDVFTTSLPSTPPLHSFPHPRKSSLTQQNSSSSLTSSTSSQHRPRKPSLTHQSSSNSLTSSTPSPHRPHKPSLTHQNSSNSLTNSTPSPPSQRQRKLSYQSSVSSQSSTGSYPQPGSGNEHDSTHNSTHNSMSSLELEDSSSEPFTYIAAGAEMNAPAVPPRSDVSLRDTYVYSAQLTAH